MKTAKLEIINGLCWFGSNSVKKQPCLVLPRVLLNGMSLKWKKKFETLFKEYYNEYPNMPEIEYCVHCRNSGTYAPLPTWVQTWRSPMRDMVQGFKREPRELKLLSKNIKIFYTIYGFLFIILGIMLFLTVQFSTVLLYIVGLFMFLPHLCKYTRQVCAELAQQKEKKLKWNS